MRLFFSIPLDEPTIDWLTLLQDRLWQSGVDGRFTLRQHWHLTLVFLGDTTWLGAAQQAAESIQLPAFELTTAQLGKFARLNGDILWLGLAPSEPLDTLVNQLTQNLLSAGFSLEKRRYHAHITLARNARLPRDFDFALHSPPPRRFAVNGFSLMESDSSTGELVYTEQGWQTLL